MRRYRNALSWLALGLVTVLLRLLLPATAVETYYSRAVYPALRAVWDHLLNRWLPIPLLYILLALGLWWLVRSARRWWRLPGWRPRLASFVMGLLGTLGGLAATFLLLWGFNYGRLPVERQLGLDLQPLSLQRLEAGVRAEAEALVAARAGIPAADTSALAARHFPEDMEDRLRVALEERLAHYGYPTTGRVRGRLLYPKGIFLRFSSAGLFFPWSGEGHIDAGLIHLQRPYTLTHELAHGYGFGDEGACSFWSYIAGIQADDPALVYATRLGYWRSLAASWLRAAPDDYRAFRDSLPSGIRNDLHAINENLAAYPDIMPRARYLAYDAYLKAQGIEEGMLNYNRVVLLVEAWKQVGEGN